MGSTYIDRGLLGSRITTVNWLADPRIWWALNTGSTLRSTALIGPGTVDTDYAINNAPRSIASQREMVPGGETGLLYYFEIDGTGKAAMQRHPSLVTYPIPPTWGFILNWKLEQGISGDLVHWSGSSFAGGIVSAIVQYDIDSGAEVDRVDYVTTSGSGTPVIMDICSHGDRLFALSMDRFSVSLPAYRHKVYLDIYTRTTPLVRLSRLTLYDRTDSGPNAFNNAFAVQSNMGLGSSAEAPAGKRLNIRLKETVNYSVDTLKTYDLDGTETSDTTVSSAYAVGERPRTHKDGLEPLPGVEQVTGTRWYRDGVGTLLAINGTTDMREWTHSPAGALSFMCITGF